MLEKLPTELLQAIFSFSLNLDLPLVSPIIAGKLSDEHTFLSTIISVFEPSWQVSYEIARGIRRWHPPDLLAGDPPLQVRFYML